MDFAFRSTTTADAWRDWNGTNVAVTDGTVEIAPDTHAAYGSLERLPGSFEPVDLALDDCGDLYLLSSAGEVFRYDPVRDSLDELACTWRPADAGEAVAITVTRRSICVAGANGHVQAYARQVLQTRWVLTAPFRSPVALDRDGDTVFVLDGGDGSTDGGFLARIRDAGTVDRVVDGLGAPRDLASDGETAYVLAGSAGNHEIRAYDAGDAFAERPAVAVPGDLEATCVEAEPAGSPVVGAVSRTDGEPTLYRHRGEAFERIGGISETASSLALSLGGVRGRPDGLYAVVGEQARVVFLERATERRVNPTTDRYDAQLVTRIDSGEAGTEWHRITTEFELAETGTQIRFRYLATDDEELQYSDESTALETVGGIGPTYADRLRSAGIRGLSELIEQSPEAVASAVSTETLDVSASRVADWMAEGRSRLAARDEPVDVEAIDGIGPTFGGRLRDAGIDDVSTLVDRTPAAVARIVSQGIYDVPPARAESWIEGARQLLADRDDVRGVDWTTMDRPNPQDALLSDAEGRYLWVELELVGDRFATPRIDAFRAYFPRQSYLRYLPAVYEEDRASAAFLERFLSIFESAFVDVDEELEAVTRYLDPAGAPPTALSWLGDWLAVEAGEAWPEPARRKLVAAAPALFKRRGTTAGILAIVRLYLWHTSRARTRLGEPPPLTADPEETLAGFLPDGTPRASPRSVDDAAGDDATGEGATAEGAAADDATGEGAISPADPGGAGDPSHDRAVYLLEHADLDCIEDPAVRDAYERLIPCPQCFLVLVRSWFDDEAVRAVNRIVDREQPAHAVGRAVQLQPWIQLGGNSYLGINTRLPHREFTVQESSLGKDSVLRSREDDGRVGLQARIGRDTTIS